MATIPRHAVQVEFALFLGGADFVLVRGRSTSGKRRHRSEGGSRKAERWRTGYAMLGAETLLDRAHVFRCVNADTWGQCIFAHAAF